MMQPIPYFKYNRAGKKFFQKGQPQGKEDESQPTEQQQGQSQEQDNVEQQHQPQNEEH